MKMFYVVERHVFYKDGRRHENEFALLDGLYGRLYTSYETAKQAIIKVLVPHSESVKGSSHRTTEHVEVARLGGIYVEEMWRVAAKDRNDYDTEYFVKEAIVVPE